jgi:putative copper resistance protein D
MTILEIISLYIHLVASVIFVGGSVFMWLALLPATRNEGLDRQTANRVLFVASRRFGRVVDVSLGLLIVTGLYNATWYLPDMNFSTIQGRLLLTKSILVVIMIFVIYFNNLYHAKKIVRLSAIADKDARAGDELYRIRRLSRVLSAVSLTLMFLVLLFAVMLQIPP